MEDAELGQKQPNAFGLYDMLGNVSETRHKGHPMMFPPRSLARYRYMNTELGSLGALFGNYCALTGRLRISPVPWLGKPIPAELLGERYDLI